MRVLPEPATLWTVEARAAQGLSRHSGVPRRHTTGRADSRPGQHRIRQRRPRPRLHIVGRRSFVRSGHVLRPRPTPRRHQPRPREARNLPRSVVCCRAARCLSAADAANPPCSATVRPWNGTPSHEVAGSIRARRLGIKIFSFNRGYCPDGRYPRRVTPRVCLSRFPDKVSGTMYTSSRLRLGPDHNIRAGPDRCTCKAIAEAGPEVSARAPPDSPLFGDDGTEPRQDAASAGALRPASRIRAMPNMANAMNSPRHQRRSDLLVVNLYIRFRGPPMVVRKGPDFESASSTSEQPIVRGPR